MEAEGEVSANVLFSVVASSVSVLTCVFDLVSVTIAMTFGSSRVPLKNVCKLLGVKSMFKPTCWGVWVVHGSGFWVQVWRSLVFRVLGFGEEGEMVSDAIGFLGGEIGFLMKMVS